MQYKVPKGPDGCPTLATGTQVSFPHPILERKEYLTTKASRRISVCSRFEKLGSLFFYFLLFQFSSVAQSCPTLCNPMDCSMTGLPVHHQLPEPIQTHVHHIGEAIQPSHPLSSPFPPAFNLFQYQGLFQRVGSAHQVAKVLEFQHQSFQ